MEKERYGEGQRHERDPKEMKLGELVEAIVWEAIDASARLITLGSGGSPYSSEEELKRTILDGYKERCGPLVDELNKREA